MERVSGWLVVVTGLDGEMVRLRGLLGGETGSKPGPASLSLPREGHQQPEPVRAALNDRTSPPMKELYSAILQGVPLEFSGRSKYQFWANVGISAA